MCSLEGYYKNTMSIFKNLSDHSDTVSLLLLVLFYNNSNLILTGLDKHQVDVVCIIILTPPGASFRLNCKRDQLTAEHIPRVPSHWAIG